MADLDIVQRSPPRDTVTTTTHAGNRSESTASDRQVERQTVSLRKTHWTMLLISIAIIVLSCLLDVRAGRDVIVTGLPNIPVPDLCGSRIWFGIECPGCGLTRSFIYLAHGQFDASLTMHRVGWVLAVVVVAQVPYRILRLRQSPERSLHARWPRWLSAALIAMLIGNWIIGQLF